MGKKKLLVAVGLLAASALALSACGAPATTSAPAPSGSAAGQPPASVGGGTITIGINADGGHKEWSEAVCNQWKNNLGLDCVVDAKPDFSTLRKGINARELKGMYRGGWQMDYPSIENFLTPIYATGASSNDGDFSNADFDKLLKDAAADTDLAGANAKYQQAEAILGQSMPTIPLWYQDSQFGWSNKVKAVKMTPFSTFDLGSIEMVDASNNTLSIRGCTPENPLIVTNTNEVCGGNVLDSVTARLVKYNPDNAAPELDIATAIDSTDAINWTVKIKQGYKFHDGTEVKAKNFVDAWNWASYGPNGQLNSYFFEAIEGYDDLQCGTAPNDEGVEEVNCTKAPPKSDKLSGLTVVDDYTFTIKTTEATSNLQVRLGYNAFSPQPDAFFKDTSKGKTEFAKLPIGAGPYKIVKNDERSMDLTKFDGYSGSYPGAVQNVSFRIYQDTNAAYMDVVANNLDLTDTIPADKLMGDLWKTDLADRNGTKSTGVIQVITFSPTDPNFASDDVAHKSSTVSENQLKLRRALSLAIDRELITKQIFNGARTPATGWLSPVVDGYKAGQCADCVFDAAKAKQLYEEAGGYKPVNK